MFYGWKILVAAFFTNFISVGFIFYSYGAFFKSFVTDFGADRLDVSIGLSVMQLVTGFFAPFLGRVLDRHSIRGVMRLGAGLMGIGFLLGSRISALWQFYLVLGTFLALGAAMLGGLASSTLVANWFVERRGTALGVATMGVSLSGVVMAPLATRMIAWFGWRMAFDVYAAVVVLLVLPVVWRVVVDRPEQIGLRPDGNGRVPSGFDPRDSVPSLAPGDLVIDHPARLEWSAFEALRNPNFWVILGVIALNFGSLSAVLVHIIPHATDLGFPVDQAPLILSCMAGSGVLGKVGFGWLADHWDRRLAIGLAILFQALGVALLLEASRFGELLGAGLVFGFGMGGVVPLWGVLVGAAFGREAFGRVMGLMSPFMLPIHMCGVPLAGYIFDKTGSYDLAFEIYLGAYALAFTLLMFLRLPAVEPGTASDRS